MRLTRSALFDFAVARSRNRCAIKAASDAGDVSQVFSGRFLIVNIVDGSSHYLTGVAPKKIPDKSYQKQAQQVSWVFVACSCVNE